jgi:hypothetical protein
MASSQSIDTNIAARVRRKPAVSLETARAVALAVFGIERDHLIASGPGRGQLREAGAAVGLVRVQFMRNVLTAHLDFALVFAGGCEVIRKLHPQPRFFRAAESLGQTDSHFGANAGFAVNDLCKGLPCNAENLCGCRDRQAERLKAIMPDDATGMHGVFHGHGGFLIS